MVTVKTLYLGDLRTKATHLKSGTELITDAPLDNHGKGQCFSPTDLLVASLGSCQLTIMGISAQEHGFCIDGTTVQITKNMSTSPRRVSEIVVEYTFPAHITYSDKEKTFIEAAARSCPVAKSLHPDTKQTLIFHYSA